MDNSNTVDLSLIDLLRYPVDDLGSSKGMAFVEQCRQQYVDTGLCALPEFILPSALKNLSAEATEVIGDAYFCDNSHNAYLTEPDMNYAEKDVKNRLEKTFVGSIPYDRIGIGSQLRQLYLLDPLREFIRLVLGKDKLYRSVDPLGAFSVNVFVENGEHGWHFDESEFTVTLMLQKPERGGGFEYVPQIRGLADESSIIESVLDGGRDRVVDLSFTAGTLLIFGGRQTLHRVTRVFGVTPRLVPVLCYSEQPDLVNSEAVRQLFWGRTGAK